MKVSVGSIDALSREQVARWSRIQASVPDLASPYFAPEFVRAVSDAREGVEVALLEDSAGRVGFLAFERGKDDVAYPVGRSFSDFQGIVADPGLDWDPREFLRTARLRAWRFDHLVADQEPTRAFQWATAPSPFVDLTGGFDAYRAERKRAGTSGIEKILQEGRRVERRLGPLRFEFDLRDERILAELFRWKGDQLRASGQPNLLALPWVRRMLDGILGTRTPGFAGILSALYVGDTLAAAHLGMRTPTALHYWLPAYNPELAAASPGNLCFLESAKAAAATGVVRFDLGKGPEAYKERLKSGSVPVAEGAVHLNAAVGAAWRGRHRAIEWARRSPLRAALVRPVRWFRRVTSGTG